jgi:hypothetical protein
MYFYRLKYITNFINLSYYVRVEKGGKVSFIKEKAL